MCTIGPPRRPACRICFDEAGELVSPCACRGSSGVVHVECLTKWALAQRASASGKWSHFVQCELCKQGYTGKAAVALALAWAGTADAVGCDVLRGVRRTDREVFEAVEAFQNLAQTLSGKDNAELYEPPASGSPPRAGARDAKRPSFDDALKLTASTIKIAETQFGAGSITFAGAVSCRADVLTNQLNARAGYEPATGRTHRAFERRKEAVAEPEMLYRRVLAIVERLDANPSAGAPPILIKRHRIETAVSLANLLAWTGRYDEAARLQVQSLESTSEMFGRDSEQAAVCLVNLGHCLFAANRREEGVTLLREATAIRERIFGTTHPTVAHMLMELADCLAGKRASAESRKKNRAEAELYARRGADIASWTLGEYHETTQDYKERMLRMCRPRLTFWLERLIWLSFGVVLLGALGLVALACRSVWRWCVGGVHGGGGA